MHLTVPSNMYPHFRREIMSRLLENHENYLINKVKINQKSKKCSNFPNIGNIRFIWLPCLSFRFRFVYNYFIYTISWQKTCHTSVCKCRATENRKYQENDDFVRVKSRGLNDKMYLMHIIKEFLKTYLDSSSRIFWYFSHFLWWGFLIR